MGKKKQDLSKLDKEKKSKKNGLFAKLKNDKDENDEQIDYSRMTTAEYEMMFLQKFENKDSSKSSKKKSKDVLLKELEEGIVGDQPKPTNDNGIQLKELNPENKKKIKISTETKPVPPKPKYGAKMDFSWVDQKVEYVRHCPMCNNFVKTDDSTEFRCPKCNTKMNFAIYCDSCNIWFDVQSAKKYPCPKCSKIISHGNNPD